MANQKERQMDLNVTQQESYQRAILALKEYHNYMGNTFDGRWEEIGKIIDKVYNTQFKK